MQSLASSSSLQGEETAERSLNQASELSICLDWL